MSIHESDTTITIKTVYAFCDACHKPGRNYDTMPEVITGHLVSALGNPVRYMGGPLYALDGMPTIEQTEAALIQSGWTVKTIGEKRFIFCPECKEKS